MRISVETNPNMRLPLGVTQVKTCSSQQLIDNDDDVGGGDGGGDDDGDTADLAWPGGMRGAIDFFTLALPFFTHLIDWPGLAWRNARSD